MGNFPWMVPHRVIQSAVVRKYVSQGISHLGPYVCSLESRPQEDDPTVPQLAPLKDV